MKVCIYGAGAIGAYLGVSLVDAGCDVSMVARGPHLEAMQENGLTLEGIKIIEEEFTASRSKAKAQRAR